MVLKIFCLFYEEGYIIEGSKQKLFEDEVQNKSEYQAYETIRYTILALVLEKILVSLKIT
ncbi:hypothetical protein [Coxiella-like endosymbiont]|uniref:hypothetical protein n=1 Tax=Coxiella-like endosymbiont TaxID=1592897 RepID=UPI000C80ACD8|nr:hypothetical protein [Coxiella-like endosymbiont]PMB54470.1 hypothetical protein CLERM_331 [Coxiella-like endosymbiont]